MVMKESTIKKHLREALLELRTNCEPKTTALTNLIAKRAQLMDRRDKYTTDSENNPQYLSKIKQCLVFEIERLEDNPDSKWSESMVNQYCEDLKSCIEKHDNYPKGIAQISNLINSTMREISLIVQSKDHETICAKNPLIMGIIKMFLDRDVSGWWIHGNYAILPFGLESWENYGDDKSAYYFPIIYFPMTKKGKVNPRKITFQFLKVIKHQLRNTMWDVQLEISMVSIKTDVQLDFNFIMTNIHQNTQMDRELLQYIIQNKTSRVYQVAYHDYYFYNGYGLQKSFYAFLDKKEE